MPKGRLRRLVPFLRWSAVAAAEGAGSVAVFAPEETLLAKPKREVDFDVVAVVGTATKNTGWADSRGVKA